MSIMKTHHVIVMPEDVTTNQYMEVSETENEVCEKWIFDFHRVQFLDVAGIITLDEKLKQLEQQGIDYEFCHVPDDISHVFELVGMYMKEGGSSAYYGF